MEIKKFCDFVTEARQRDGMPFDIQIEECAFVVKGTPYIIDLIKMSGEATFSPPDPSVGIFGDSLDDYTLTVNGVESVSKFKTLEISDNFVNLVANARFLAMDRKTVSDLAYEYINDHESDLEAVTDESELDELVKGLDDLILADIDSEILSVKSFSSKVEDLIFDAGSSWDDDQPDDDYEEPDDWD
jgi:hypothetical protein